jgi:gliding motility-associated-like protein
MNDVITVKPDVTTTYYFSVTDQFGCTGIDSITVAIDPEGDWYMPNAFSPNGDNDNPVFFVVNEGPVFLEYFRIYDRWGRLVFESAEAGEAHGWDGTYKGKDQPVGVYTYVVKSISIVTGEVKLESGNVTLLR